MPRLNYLSADLTEPADVVLEMRSFFPDPGQIVDLIGAIAFHIGASHFLLALKVREAY